MTAGSELDAAQRTVLALPVGATAVVVGAPGTGKTTALIELAAHRVRTDGFVPDDLLVIGATRRSAAELRDRLGVRLGSVSSGPLARTATSVAFEAVRARALAEGEAGPRLLSGAEHDLVIRELLEGDEVSGTGPDWPPHLDPTVRRLRTFRTELRELMMRATEFAVTPDRLRELADPADRPEWRAAADFITRYNAVVATVRSDHLDPAEFGAFAEAAIDAGLHGERLSHVRLILVDDLQQLTEGTVRLLQAFARRGVAVVGFGDPDIAGNSFRGGDPSIVGRLGARLGATEAPTLVLDTVHRHGPAVRAVVQAVTGRIGAAGEGRQRAARSAADDGDEPVRSITASSLSPLHAAVARQLRERHLLDGVPWSQMAVIVRSGGSIAGFARALAAAQVPARTLMGSRAVRDEVAAAALLRIVEVAIGRVELDGAVAGELLTGPLGPLDAVGLRRLRLALRADALEHGYQRSADELLAEALGQPGALALLSHEVTRGAQHMASLLLSVREAHAKGATAEEVLWAAWQGAGVADDWKRTALGSGLAADEANRALDGVVALFTSARRFVERTPSATADQFLAEILDAEVPEDTLAPQPDGEAVLVITPSAATGFAFDTVVVAGLQEGAWPNLRIRGSLLGAPQLTAAVTERLGNDVDERRAVLDDELRLFALAVSRAGSRLILAAVDSDDETPSALFRLAAEGAVPVSAEPAPLTVRGLTGRLRRVLTAERVDRDGVSRPAFDEDDRASAAAVLRSFGEADVPGAAPDAWRGLHPVSTTAPIWDLDDPEQRVPISPSRLAEVERSPMEWFVSRVAGGGSGLAANLGTLLHDVMEHAQTTDAETLWQSMLERWHELAFDSPWHGEMQRVIARRWVDALSAYLTHFERDGKVLVSAEDEFRLDIAPAVLTGKIDRIESHDGAIVIVDLKTGNAKSAEEAADHPQLGAYQVAYADGAIAGLPDGHRAGGAALLFTKQGSGRGSARVPYTVRLQEAFDDEQLAAFRTRVRTAALRMVGPVLRAAMIDDPYAHGSDLRRVHLPGEVSGD